MRSEERERTPATETTLIEEVTLTQMLEHQSVVRPGSTFLVFESEEGVVTELSYAEFAGHVEQLASGLAACGVEAGDRVFLQLPNCLETVAAFFAVARLGAIFVPSNTANRSLEISYLASVTKPAIALTDAAGLAAVEAGFADADAAAPIVVCGGGPATRLSYRQVVASAHGELTTPVAAPTEPVQILFSSGTTARPKGVVVTHTNCLTSGWRQSTAYGADDSDRFLTVLPLFHANAQSTTLFAALVVGGGAVFLERYSARRFWEQMRRHRTTRLTLVPMLLRTLNTQPVHPDERDHLLRSIGYATNVSEPVTREFEERFGVRLTNAYGLTEALTEVTIGPVDGPRRWPSVGVPAVGREVRVVDEDGRECDPNEVGEIQIRGVPGRSIMKEYYRDPDATARALVNGWLHTHDVGWIDEHGYLYFHDREQDLIKCANENVSALEIEAALLGHPGIAAAAVIGIPDPVRDEAIKAFVVAADGSELTETDVQEYCRARMATFKVPAVVEVCDELPQTAVGKIQKKLLRGQS